MYVATPPDRLEGNAHTFATNAGWLAEFEGHDLMELLTPAAPLPPPPPAEDVMRLCFDQNFQMISLNLT